MKRAKIGGDEKGHKPFLTQGGKWIQCSVCQMTKRKAGWWKPCQGPPKKPQKWMGE